MTEHQPTDPTAAPAETVDDTAAQDDVEGHGRSRFAGDDQDETPDDVEGHSARGRV